MKDIVIFTSIQVILLLGVLLDIWESGIAEGLAFVLLAALDFAAGIMVKRRMSSGTGERKDEGSTMYRKGYSRRGLFRIFIAYQVLLILIGILGTCGIDFLWGEGLAAIIGGNIGLVIIVSKRAGRIE